MRLEDITVGVPTDVEGKLRECGDLREVEVVGEVGERGEGGTCLLPDLGM